MLRESTTSKERNNKSYDTFLYKCIYKILCYIFIVDSTFILISLSTNIVWIFSGNIRHLFIFISIFYIRSIIVARTHNIIDLFKSEYLKDLGSCNVEEKF